MRLSIIVPFLNSHELVRRHILYLKTMRLPDDVEILYMDDGSDPPILPFVLSRPELQPLPKQLTIHATNEFRPWTSSLARNTAATIAIGGWFLMTDGDYIVPEKAILHARAFSGDRNGFHREFGVLDEQGRFTQDPETLIRYGLPRERFTIGKGVKFPPHPNNFVMRREVFFAMGGYDEDRILNRPYPQGEDREFKRTLRKFEAEGKLTLPTVDDRATIYLIPNGQFCGDVDYNPKDQNGKELMHTLTRKTPSNHWYVCPRPGVKGIKDEQVVS